MTKDDATHTAELALAEHGPADRTLLIVDDDKPFAERLGRAMAARGFETHVATSVAEALAALQATPPGFAVIDLKLADGSGLDVMKTPEGTASRGACDHPDRLRGDRHRRRRCQARRLRLSRQARQRRRDRGGADLREARRDRQPRAPDVGRPRALGAHSARLRKLRAQRLGDRAPAQHASQDAAAHSRQTRAEIDLWRLKFHRSA